MTLATGGTVTDIFDGGIKYRVHTFTTSGNFVVTEGGDVEYLVVAGGGGGGGFTGGGGGAGGLLTNLGGAGLTVSPQSYAVTVGAGGLGGGNVFGSTTVSSGSNSAALGLTAVGGGRGGHSNTIAAAAGGSGGGGSDRPTRLGGAGTAGQGNAGGDVTGVSDTRYGAGGGGAGGAGQSGVRTAAFQGEGGDGGAGLGNAITGSSLFYAGGGGGASNNIATDAGGAGGSGGGGAGGSIGAGLNGASGAVNTGSGGGGGARDGAAAGSGGDGGDGIVIIRYSLVVPNWTPEPQVTLDGINYTANTIESVSIVRGRDTVYQPPSSGYARVQIVDLEGNGLPIDIATTLTVAVQDIFGDPLTVFSGYVTDIAADLYDPGLGQLPSAIYSIYAVGPLARLSRRIILDGGRPAETDGLRIAAAVQAGLSATFDETAGAWEDIDPALTWETFDPGYDPALIDSGVFDLVALPAADTGYSALEVAEQASFSGEGLLYETLDGFVGWDNADARGNLTSPIVVPGDILNAAGLRTASSVSDLVNRAIVQYPTGAETAQDLTAIQTFTLFERVISTQLADSTAAGDRAASYVERHAYPVINLDAVTIRLDTVDDALLRGALLEVRSGSFIRLTSLPATLGVTYLDAFVEGTSLRLDQQRAELRLTVSDASLSYSQVRWSGVTPALDWSTVDGTLEWQDARSL